MLRLMRVAVISDEADCVHFFNIYDSGMFPSCVFLAGLGTHKKSTWEKLRYLSKRILMMIDT